MNDRSKLARLIGGLAILCLVNINEDEPQGGMPQNATPAPEGDGEEILTEAVTTEDNAETVAAAEGAADAEVDEPGTEPAQEV